MWRMECFAGVMWHNDIHGTSGLTLSSQDRQSNHRSSCCLSAGHSQWTHSLQFSHRIIVFIYWIVIVIFNKMFLCLFSPRPCRWIEWERRVGCEGAWLSQRGMKAEKELASTRHWAPGINWWSRFTPPELSGTLAITVLHYSILLLGIWSIYFL